MAEIAGTAVQNRQENWPAVTSLVLGIVSFLPTPAALVTAPLAIFFGISGRGRARAGAPQRGLATAGLVLGIVAVVVAIMFVLAFVAWSSGSSSSSVEIVQP